MNEKTLLRWLVGVFGVIDGFILTILLVAVVLSPRVAIFKGEPSTLIFNNESSVITYVAVEEGERPTTLAAGQTINILMPGVEGLRDVWVAADQPGGSGVVVSFPARAGQRGLAITIEARTATGGAE
jgi:hypothetical protein